MFQAFVAVLQIKVFQATLLTKAPVTAKYMEHIKCLVSNYFVTWVMRNTFSYQSVRTQEERSHYSPGHVARMRRRGIRIGFWRESQKERDH
jgi:hypothetical protein